MLEWISTLANLATVIIAFFTAWYGIVIFKHQRTSSDVKLALELFATINYYWDRINDNKSASYQYDMGQIFAHFETAAHLFNESILTKDALPILKDHIVEVYTSVQGDESGKKFIESCCSSPTTFEELRKFLAKYFPAALLAQQYVDKKNQL